MRRKKRIGEDPEVDAVIAELARRREVARAAITHLRFVQDSLIDQKLVQDGLRLGLSQVELAGHLGMSKREVNRLANLPPAPWAASRAEPAMEALRVAFLTLVWSRDDDGEAAGPTPLPPANRHGR